MATKPIAPAKAERPAASAFLARLRDPSFAIASPKVDAWLLWGAPIAVLTALILWLQAATFAFPGIKTQLHTYAFLFATMITHAHLVAVAPRAYLNRDVFAANRFRLTVVPIILLAAMTLSWTAFAIAAVVAFFWDVHHSAMQTFGISRIYDFKAGNGPRPLRKTDLLLNWLLYVGPIFVGASFVAHAEALKGLADTPLTVLASAPGLLEAGHGGIRTLALAVWAGGIALGVASYRKAMLGGYRVPPQKLALMANTGAVAFLAWGYLPPLIAFATINIHHAVQYYVIVWVQEGKRMADFARLPPSAAFGVFVLLTAIVAVGYGIAVKVQSHLLLVPFVACSLLHFWYDGFVWSVSKGKVRAE